MASDKNAPSYKKGKGTMWERHLVQIEKMAAEAEASRREKFESREEQKQFIERCFAKGLRAKQIAQLLKVSTGYIYILKKQYQI